MAFGPKARTGTVGLLLCALLIVAGAQRTGDAQTIRVRTDDYWVSPGDSVVVPIEIETGARDVTGFSFGVSHDATKLSLEQVVPTDELLTLTGLTGEVETTPEAPDIACLDSFFCINTAPDGGDGFTVGAVLGPDKPAAEAIVLAANGTHHLFNVVYKVGDTARGNASIALTGELGSPPVDLVVDVSGGIPRTFAESTEQISVGVEFLRGDANGDGDINITDAIFILQYLFMGGALGTCPVALNFDGTTVLIDEPLLLEPGQTSLRGEIVQDGANVINITDAVSVLGYLFQRGPEPPAPFPTCGQSDSYVAPSAVCRQYSGCP